jgi:hypothetical protein
MTQDAWLAIAHHVAVFGLLAVIATEWGLVRPGLDAGERRRLLGVDRLYGIVAGAVLLIGLARLEFGAGDWGFYTDNPFFWLKLAHPSLSAVGQDRRCARGERCQGRAPRPAAGAGGIPPHPDLCRPHGPRHRTLTDR